MDAVQEWEQERPDESERDSVDRFEVPYHRVLLQVFPCRSHLFPSNKGISTKLVNGGPISTEKPFMSAQLRPLGSLAFIR